RVGWRDRQTFQLVPFGLEHVLTELRRRFSDRVAHEEVQLDRALGVDVGGRQQLLAHMGVEGELFLQFPGQATGEGFSGVAFAAGKLPVTFEVYAPRTASHEESAIALDDR